MYCQGKKERDFSRNLITLGYVVGGFWTSFLCQDLVLKTRKDNIMTWSMKLHYSMVLFFSLQSLTETRVSSQFDLSVWVRSSFTAMPLAGVICPSPIQGLHEVVQPTSPNITIASHLPWILSCSIATAHSHSIPFPFLQGPHKVNPNLFARDGLIITLTCLASRSLHRDNRALLLIHMQLFALYFIYLDSKSYRSLLSQRKLKTATAFRWMGVKCPQLTGISHHFSIILFTGWSNNPVLGKTF